MPTPFLLLVAAALLPGSLDVDVAQPLAVAALVVVMLQGGMDVDLRGARFAVLTLGIVGTFVTCGAVALVAHAVLGYGWIAAGVLGAALAPTDPAMVFALLRGSGLRPRLRTLLEGEAGINDPAGVALMAGMVELATRHDATFSVVVVEFVRQMGIGAVLGFAGGRLLRRAPHPLLLLLGAGALYVGAELLGGSGFLAVFVAGFAVPRRDVGGPAAEVAAFALLGATVALGGLGWGDGLVLAAALTLSRPAIVLLVGLRGRERAFVAFAGLRGAMPILLAVFAVTGGVAGARELLGVVFAATAANVLVVGGLLPRAALRLDVAAER
jgi:cell volume regulation protein A